MECVTTITTDVPQVEDVLMLWIRREWQQVSSGLSLVMKAPRPDQHFGGFERIISQPQLPDYAAIIAVVSRVGEVLSVQVGLETAGNV